jgi:general secretion pathway protein D
VLIEAAIAEVTGDAAEALGVQFAAGGAAVLDGVSGGTSFANTGVSLGSIIQALVPGGVGLVGSGLSLAGGSRGNFNILVQALGTSTKANLLSTPSITTLDNQPAEIVVGQNVPFRTGSFGTDGNTLTPFTTIERQDVGITLRVVPRIHEGDSIRLEVSQEVSSLVGSVTGAADLITNRRSIQTTVLADNGDTIVLGGLITDDRTATKSQVPLLGDIPVLGNLFKSRQQTQTKRTLFVFLRPTILRDRASVVAAAKVKYERLRAQEAGDPDRSILLHPPVPRLPLEIQGIY